MTLVRSPPEFVDLPSPISSEECQLNHKMTRAWKNREVRDNADNADKSLTRNSKMRIRMSVGSPSSNEYGEKFKLVMGDG